MSRPVTMNIPTAVTPSSTCCTVEGTTSAGGGGPGEIADNLLADGKIEPMIIVMPNVAYRDPEGVGMADCELDLLNVILPLAESNYRVRADADHRALAGLSMGAGQTLAIGVKHPELFHWLGVFSNGLPKAPLH